MVDFNQALRDLPLLLYRSAKATAGFAIPDLDPVGIYRRTGIELMNNATALWSRPGFLVRRLHQISVAIFLEEMANLEITPVQYGALMIVAANPRIDQSALAAELGVDRANAGDVLARLSNSGYLTRQPSATDRRYIQLGMTKKGTLLLRNAAGRARKVQDRLLMPLAPKDRKAFVAMMSQIIGASNHVGRAALRIKKRNT
jgi:DNA-binding MarR family transcriptional regulator